MTYFPAGQYHRRLGLNCCVRDGNRCDPKPLVTDKSRPSLSIRPRWIQRMVQRVCWIFFKAGPSGRNPIERGLKAENKSVSDIRFTDRSHNGSGASCGARRRTVDATKLLTVRNAPLKTFLSLHARPINLVVFQGSHVLLQAGLISRGASRLDAFSGYPCRT